MAAPTLTASGGAAPARFAWSSSRPRPSVRGSGRGAAGGGSGLGPHGHPVDEAGARAPRVRSLLPHERGVRDALYAGYRAAVDWPTCAFWRELTAAYPDAKVILTERAPDRWYESYEATIRAGMPLPEPDGSPDRDDDSDAALMRTVIVQRSFGGRLEPKAHLLERYRRHVDEVTSESPRPASPSPG